jgi:hypothetical protein
MAFLPGPTLQKRPLQRNYHTSSMENEKGKAVNNKFWGE